MQLNFFYVGFYRFYQIAKRGQCTKKAKSPCKWHLLCFIWVYKAVFLTLEAGTIFIHCIAKWLLQFIAHSRYWKSIDWLKNRIEEWNTTCHTKILNMEDDISKSMIIEAINHYHQNALLKCIFPGPIPDLLTLNL